MKKILVLGGAGLIAGHVASRLIKMGGGYEVCCIDIAEKGRPGLEGATYQKMNALQKGRIIDLLADMQPEIIINGINVATIFSANPHRGYRDMVEFYINLYKGMLALKHPFHYIHLGTTGSGGLGLNIPFTHGDKIEHLPIINKAAFSGISTSMLTLLSRSLPEGAKVSEIKPGLSIFADEITVGKQDHANLIVLNGGESGDYTYDELALLTSFMGFTTVTKIVDKVIGIITDQKRERTDLAHDVVAAMNSVIVSSEADDLELRNQMLEKMLATQGSHYVIATGNLGPPSITRDLLLAAIRIRRLYHHGKDMQKVMEADADIAATMAYIRYHDPKLHRYLIKECNEANFNRLGEYYVSGMEHPWQIVRASLRT